MYEHDYRREGLTFHPAFLYPLDDSLFAYAFWLDEKYREWTFLRRVLLRVKCINPESGLEDVPFIALVSDAPVFFDTPVQRWAAAVLDEFVADSTEFERCLCDCLCALSPSNYREMVKAFRDDLDDELAHEEYAALSDSWREKGAWVFHLLGNFDVATQLIAKWRRELFRLRSGDIRAQWRGNATVLGAARGGKKSGESRARQARLSAEAASAAFEALRKEGRAVRNIAGIVAQRHGVSADYVRRLLKNKKPT